MRLFPLRYGVWKLRMVGNLVRERREYLALGGTALLLGLVGTLALWRYGSDALFELATTTAPRDSQKVLSLLAFSIYVAYLFMALANVITRFFGTPRMEEREQLMGPLSPGTMFVTELVDVFRLPLLILSVGLVAPLLIAGFRLELPYWLLALATGDLIALYLQPTLLVMALYIAVIRFIPSALLGRHGLLFAFFFLLAGLGAAVLDAIRHTYLSAEGWSLAFPSTWAASILPFYQSGHVRAVLDLSLRVHVLTCALLAITWVLYRYAFLERLEVFGVHLTATGPGGEERESWLRRQLFRRLPQPVAAIVLKDLRSSLRDAAQRVAFTALAAVICAMVAVDLLFGRTNANIFLPVFFAYALFLVSCQGLSTFSAEGGVLENLAQLPLEAAQLLRAKVVGHFVMFSGVIGMAAVLAALAPSPFPFWFRVPAAGMLGVVLIPLGGLLAWITVTLGAIFPKPGEGGGRKEISIFAMGLFFQLTALFLLSVPAAVAVPIFFGPRYGVVVVLVALLWWGVLRFLYLMALRAVERALGAEIRAG